MPPETSTQATDAPAAPRARVLYVSHSGLVSGAEISLLELVRALPSDVEAGVATPRGRLADQVAAAGVPVFPLAASEAAMRLSRQTPVQIARLAQSAIQVARHAARFDATVLHANSTRAGLMAVATPSPKRPTVVHIRDWMPSTVTARSVRLALAARADAIVANSEFTLRTFLEGTRYRGIAAAIANPVQMDRFTITEDEVSHEREALGIPPGAHVLVVLAQITPWKAQDDAIRILATLRDRGLDCVLLLVGDPLFVGSHTYYDNIAYARSLSELVFDLGLTDRVRFLGWRDDVPRVLAAADLVLVPSWREPFGRAAAEAMAIGKPVLATSVGGTTEIIDDGVEGFLLPPRSHQRWADEIYGLLGDPARRAEMGAAGRRRAEKQFAPEQHAEAIASLYDAVTV